MSFIKKLFGKGTLHEASAATNEAMSSVHCAIEQALQGHMPITEMLSCLVAGNIFVPLAGPPKMDGDAIKSWKPATVSKADGSQWVVAFTSPDLASAFAKQNASYSHGLSVRTTWVLQVLPPQHGIAFNIGFPSMFEWNAEGLTRYKMDVLT